MYRYVEPFSSFLSSVRPARSGRTDPLLLLTSHSPEFEYTASLVKPEEVKNVKITLAAPEYVVVSLVSTARSPSDARPPAGGTTSATASTPTTRTFTRPRSSTLPTSPRRTARSSPTCTTPGAATSSLTTRSSPTSCVLSLYLSSLSLTHTLAHVLTTSFFRAVCYVDARGHEGRGPGPGRRPRPVHQALQRLRARRPVRHGHRPPPVPRQLCASRSPSFSCAVAVRRS